MTCMNDDARPDRIDSSRPSRPGSSVVAPSVLSRLARRSRLECSRPRRMDAWGRFVRFLVKCVVSVGCFIPMNE